MASRLSQHGERQNDEQYPLDRTHVIWQGCTNPGSGMRRIEAQIVGIPNIKEQNWRLLCGSTPMTWNHTTYNTPTHCDERVSYV